MYDFSLKQAYVNAWSAMRGSRLFIIIMTLVMFAVTFFIMKPYMDAAEKSASHSANHSVATVGHNTVSSMPHSMILITSIFVGIWAFYIVVTCLRRFWQQSVSFKDLLIQILNIKYLILPLLIAVTVYISYIYLGTIISLILAFIINPVTNLYCAYMSAPVDIDSSTAWRLSIKQIFSRFGLNWLKIVIGYIAIMAVYGAAMFGVVMLGKSFTTAMMVLMPVLDLLALFFLVPFMMLYPGAICVQFVQQYMDRGNS